MKHGLILLCLAVFLSGCNVAAPKKTDSEQGGVKIPQKTLERNDRKYDPNYYYASKYDTARLIYCGADPRLRRISIQIERFATLERAKARFPAYRLHVPCDSL